MSYEKNDKVIVQKQETEMRGIVKDRFIQETELEYKGSTLLADASEENPVYLIEFENGQQEMVAEPSMNKAIT
jgi:hypothetical protein